MSEYSDRLHQYRALRARVAQLSGELRDARHQAVDAGLGGGVAAELDRAEQVTRNVLDRLREAPGHGQRPPARMAMELAQWCLDEIARLRYLSETQPIGPEPLLYLAQEGITALATTFNPAADDLALHLYAVAEECRSQAVARAGDAHA